MHRSKHFVAAFLALVVIATSCGSSDDKSGANDSKSTGKNVATGVPIPVGYVNTTEDPVTGGYPDGWDGARAAERHINEELGGVNGRPIKLSHCNVTTAPETGTACASKLLEGNPVVVLDGVNSVGDTYMPALNKAGVPYMSMAPLSTQEYTSPNSFLTTGGGATIGPTAALFALGIHAKKMVIIYLDSPTTKLFVENFTQKPLEPKGVAVDMIPVPLVAPDMAPVLSAALARKPDVIYMLGADAHCIGTYKAMATNPPKVPVIFQGGCATQKDIVAGGKVGAEGVYFVTSRASGYPNPGHHDWEEYKAAMAKYYPKTTLIGGAAGNSFATVMDLYAVMKTISGELTKESVTSALKGLRDFPLYFGGTATCDGKQFPGLAGVCSTYSVMEQYKNGKYIRAKVYPTVLALYK